MPDFASEEEGDTEKAKKIMPKAKPATISRAKGKGKGKGGIQIPEVWPWEDAKALFEKPDVLPADEVEVIFSPALMSSVLIEFKLEWKNPDIDGLVQFLVTEKGFK